MENFIIKILSKIILVCLSLGVLSIFMEATGLFIQYLQLVGVLFLISLLIIFLLISILFFLN